MEQRTCNIINICKGNGSESDSKYTIPDRIRRYLGNECIYPWEKYSDKMLEGIMLTALYDFIDHADRPSSVLRDLFREHSYEQSFIDHLVEAFCGIPVRDGSGKYINGFTEELLKQSDKEI